MSITLKKDLSNRKCSRSTCRNPYKKYYDNDGHEIWYKDGRGGYSHCKIRYKSSIKCNDKKH